MSEAVLKRAARIADGWFPQFRPGPAAAETVARFRQYVQEAGRASADAGIEGRISLFNTPEGEWGAALQSWRDLGATHVTLNTMNAGLATPQAHIDAIRRFSTVAGLAG